MLQARKHLALTWATASPGQMFGQREHRTTAGKGSSGDKELGTLLTHSQPLYPGSSAPGKPRLQFLSRGQKSGLFKNNNNNNNFCGKNI